MQEEEERRGTRHDGDAVDRARALANSPTRLVVRVSKKLIVSRFFADVDKAAGLVMGKFINGFGCFSTCAVVRVAQRGRPMRMERGGVGGPLPFFPPPARAGN